MKYIQSVLTSIGLLSIKEKSKFEFGKPAAYKNVNTWQMKK
jgi:hypothetical protein